MHRFLCFLVHLALSLLFSGGAQAEDDEKDLSGIQTFVTVCKAMLNAMRA